MKHKNATRRGYSLVCKPCTRARDRLWRRENREWLREYDKEYNLRNRKLFGTNRKPSDAYINLARERGEVCEICGRKGRGRRLAVDHDHKSGRVRGLLCWKCNTGIGLLQEDRGILERAKEYLDE
jgi:hypothetical protein